MQLKRIGLATILVAGLILILWLIDYNNLSTDCMSICNEKMGIKYSILKNQSSESHQLAIESDGLTVKLNSFFSGKINCTCNTNFYNKEINIKNISVN